MGNLEPFDTIIAINQKELYLPIVKVRAIISPLFVGDDLSLRTMMTSPDIYEEKISTLLCKHTKFAFNQENENSFNPVSYDEFVSGLSNIDRLVLIWGLVNSTYKTLGKVSVTCPECDNSFKDEITFDQTIHEESITPWEEDVVFDKYFYNITIEIEAETASKIVFKTKLPSIKKNLETIKTLTPEQLKENFEKFGILLTRKHEMINMIDEVSIYDKDSNVLSSVSNSDDLFTLFDSKIPQPMATELTEEYNNHFKKYSVKFGKPYICSECQHKFEFDVDPETELFRKYFSW